MAKAAAGTGSSGVRWGISQQGLALVLLLLLGQLAIGAGLLWLLGQAEAAADRMERARKVSATADSLMLTVYYTGDGLGRLAKALQGQGESSSQSSHRQAIEQVHFLKDEMPDNQAAIALLNSIERNINVCLPVMDKIESLQNSLEDERSLQEWRDRRAQIQPNVKELVRDVSALLHLCRNLDSSSPLEAQVNRETTLKVLYLTLALNVLAILATFALFTWRITRRMSTMRDNFERFREHRALLPPVGGSDELAYLDEVFRDAARKLDRERRLNKSSEERMRLLVESLPTGIVVLDDKSRIEFVNEQVERDFSQKAHHMVGKPLRDFVSGESAAKTVGTFGKLYQGQGRDGQFPLEGREIALVSGGQRKSMFVLQNLSERFALEREREQFVSMVRQQLREPLKGISDFLAKLSVGRLGVISPKAYKSCRQMEMNIDRLLTLLNDLFDLDKLETGKVDVEPCLTPLNLILERTFNALSMFAEKYKVKLEVPPSQLSVYADANRIVQVLVNLASNAVKFSEKGGVVTIATRLGNDCVEIAVIDRGRGIPKEKLDLIFEPYKQVEEGDAKAKGGTGLGLAICKAIIEGHNGAIGVESEEGKGSLFWIRLPLREGQRV